MRGMSVFRRICLAVASLFCCAGGYAAELRVSFVELAAVLNPILDETGLRLHNVPSEGILGGLFDPTKTSYVKFGGTEVPLEFPVTKFPLTGIGNGQYAYYLNDINSSSIRVEPTAKALVLAIRFESNDAELVSSCYSGTCGFASVLPIVHWRRPQVRLHLTPSRFDTGITLTVSKIIVGGRFKTVCRASSLFCLLGQSAADNYINRLRKRYIPSQLLKQLNAGAARETIAARLSPYLNLGGSGRVSIRKIAVANGSIRVRFKLP